MIKYNLIHLLRLIFLPIFEKAFWWTILKNVFGKTLFVLKNIDPFWSTLLNWTLFWDTFEGHFWKNAFLRHFLFDKSEDTLWWTTAFWLSKPYLEGIVCVISMDVIWQKKKASATFSNPTRPTVFLIKVFNKWVFKNLLIKLFKFN